MLQTARSCRQTTENLSRRNVELQRKIVELKAKVEDECMKNFQLPKKLEMGQNHERKENLKYDVAQQIKKIKFYQIKHEKILAKHGDILKTKREVEKKLKYSSNLS